MHELSTSNDRVLSKGLRITKLATENKLEIESKDSRV